MNPLLPPEPCVRCHFWDNFFGMFADIDTGPCADCCEDNDHSDFKPATGRFVTYEKGGVQVKRPCHPDESTMNPDPDKFHARMLDNGWNPIFVDPMKENP